jgi:hypothetical protein
MVTGFLIQKLIEKNLICVLLIEQICLVSISLVKNMDKLVDYKVQLCLFKNQRCSDAMVEVAETHNLFDGDMYPEYLTKELLETYHFLVLL